MTFYELQKRGFSLTETEYLAASKEVFSVLKESLDESRRLIRAFYDKLEGVKPEDYFNEAVKFNRLQQIENQLIKQYNVAAAKISQVVPASSKVAISNAYYRQMYALEIGSSLIDTKFTQALISEKVINASVYGTRELWANRFGKTADYVPRSGALLKAILAGNREEDLEKVRRVITKSLSLQQGYAKASERIKDILDTTAYNAERIMRTEGHRNAMAGQMAMTESARADGMNVRRQIVSVLDDSTRPQSAEVDGLFENDDGYFVYPDGTLVKQPGNSGVAGWDINDREAVVDVIEGVDPQTRRARDPLTGKTDIISYKNFDEWAKEIGLKKNRYGQLIQK